MIVHDLAGCGPSKDLDQLMDLHRRWFPEHGHVLPEIEEAAGRHGIGNDIVTHLLLASIDGVGVGFAIALANLQRSIGLVHFLAVNQDRRGPRPFGPTVAELLVRTAEQLVVEDGRSAGRPIEHGVVAESDPDVLRSWSRWGFDPLAIAYAEPYFGRHWADHGEPNFFAMTLVANGSASSGSDRRNVGRSACEAFLLDHYGLDPAQPRVVEIFDSIEQEALSSVTEGRHG